MTAHEACQRTEKHCFNGRASGTQDWLEVENNVRDMN
jgi:hypothetical protein